MVIDDQSEVVSFLSAPSTHGGVNVERVDTHTAMVFLAGDRAYKLKRAVRFDYVDFSTKDLRRACCEAEVRLNRRTAPSLYRRVLAVRRESSGGLALAQTGSAVDWLVEMNRFDQNRLFDRLAAAGSLAVEVMAPLAAGIADFHKGAEVRSDHGGSSGMSWVIEGNAAGFEEFGAGLGREGPEQLTRLSRSELERCTGLLDRRRGAGFVKQCHGDLHLRNIVLLDGRPTLFDGVEFNDEVSCIDVVYDLAFLLMDLWRRELPGHANAVLNRYFAETGDLEALTLLPLFLSCRAAIRAKTSVTAAQMNGDTSRAPELQRVAAGYLDMASRFLSPPPPNLVVIGGLSGSGKSALALALAPALGAAPGAMVFRSDEIRKRLCGVDPMTPLAAQAYFADVSSRVYTTLRRSAAATLRAGQSVIVDAVHANPAERLAVERVAEEAGVPFVGIWLDASESLRIDRVERRRGDPSDADAVVVRQQKPPAGAMSWHRVDAGRPLDAVVESVRDIVRRSAGASLSA